MKIGIIGSGAMGRYFAAQFVKLGHAVSIANSRGPASLQQVASDTGAEAATVEEATRDKSVVIVSIPQKNVQDLPKRLFAHLPKDVLVIDTCNYYPDIRDGIIPELEQSGIDSLWVQQQPGSSIYCRDLNLEEIKKRVLAMGDEWSAQRDAIRTKH